MKSQFIFSGIGGQGVMSIGELLCSAACKLDYVVTFAPSYGQEKRGGRTMCQIVVAEEMGSPIISAADLLMVMDERSLHDYQELLAPGGRLIINSDLVDALPDRTDVEVLAVPFNTIAKELGNAKCANMVALGFCLRYLTFITPEQVKPTLAEIFPGGKAKLIPLNEQAIDAGFSYQLK